MTALTGLVVVQVSPHMNFYCNKNTPIIVAKDDTTVHSNRLRN